MHTERRIEHRTFLMTRGGNRYALRVRECTRHELLELIAVISNGKDDDNLHPSHAQELQPYYVAFDAAGKAQSPKRERLMEKKVVKMRVITLHQRDSDKTIGAERRRLQS